MVDGVEDSTLVVRVLSISSLPLLDSGLVAADEADGELGRSTRHCPGFWVNEGVRHMHSQLLAEGVH